MSLDLEQYWAWSLTLLESRYILSNCFHCKKLRACSFSSGDLLHWEYLGVLLDVIVVLAWYWWYLGFTMRLAFCSGPWPCQVLRGCAKWLKDRIRSIQRNHFSVDFEPGWGSIMIVKQRLFISGWESTVFTRLHTWIPFAYSLLDLKVKAQWVLTTVYTCIVTTWNEAENIFIVSWRTPIP